MIFPSRSLREDCEKEQAFRGMCMMVAQNPQARKAKSFPSLYIYYYSKN